MPTLASRRPPVRLRSILPPALALVALLASAGCKGPCQELADKICECEPNTNMVNACKYNAESFNTDDPNAVQEDQCERFLKSCTCDALAAEEYKLCGLTRDATLSGDQ